MMILKIYQTFVRNASGKAVKKGRSPAEAALRISFMPADAPIDRRPRGAISQRA